MRLDRILINDNWVQNFQNNYVKHLSRSGFDRRPLLLKCQNLNQTHIKYFKFINFWVNQLDFLDIIQTSWNEEVRGNAMWRLRTKIKRLSKFISIWSKH